MTDVCWYCRNPTVVWNNDFDASDVYGEGVEGIVTYLHCTSCGAQITYERIQEDEEL